MSVNKRRGGSTDGVSGNRSTGCVSGGLPSCETLLSGKSSKLPFFVVLHSTVYVLELSGSFNLEQSSCSPNNSLKYRAFRALVFSTFSFLFLACAVLGLE